MERLKIVLLIATVVATAQISTGQQQVGEPAARTSSSSIPASYVVIGDVQNCNHFPISPEKKVTIREAATAAGLPDGPVSVSVIRGTQERALWTQTISSTSTDSGETVQSGDILVVQAMQPPASPIRKNAVLRTDSGIIPIALGDDSVAVGDVLQQTGNLPSQGQSVSVACRFQGHPPLANANLFDRVYHGDVITVLQNSRTSLKGFGSMKPAFSEWKGDSKVPASPAGLAFGEPEVSAPNPNLQVPGSPPLSPDFTFPGVEPAEPVNEVPPLPPNVSEKVFGIPVQGISQAVAVPSPIIPDEAPAPPVEVPILDEPVTELAAASPGIWNIVFVAVLLISGLLILAGSLRPEHENDVTTVEQVEKTEPVRQDVVHVISVPFVPLAAGSETMKRNFQMKPDSRVPPEFATVEMRKEAMVPKSLTEITTQQVSSAPAGLVSAHEWFGDDWRSNNTTSARPEATKSVNVEKFSKSTETPIAELPVLETARQSMTVPSAVTWPTDVSPLPAGGQGTFKQTEVARSRAETVHETAELLDDSDSFSELDDLLQNRLPVDLCNARLPMRISLFGRAAGPRRLRIDAVHTKLSGPHMNVAAERKREESVMASTTATPAAQQSISETGSLDRALHNLLDRNDS